MTTSARTSTDVEEFINAIHPDGVFEIRIPNTPDRKGGKFKATASGYFDDAKKAAACVSKWSRAEPAGIYLTINPVDGALLARSTNKIEFRAKHTTSDEDTTRRRWLFIDIDPVRAAGVSATDGESARACDKQKAIRQWLTDRGWPEPLRMMSGNGAYLLYRIDLENDQLSRDLVEEFINAVADKFTDEFVDIDRKVFNASRIAKIGGTWARKGENFVGVNGTPSRPHRQSFFVKPDEFHVVDQRLVRSVIDEVQAETQATAERGARDRIDERKPSAKQQGTHKSVDIKPGNQSRCQHYVDKIPGAIEGQHGSDRTFHVACVIARFGLDEQLGWPIIETYNLRCEPPWEGRDLRRKLRQGIEKVSSDGEFGSWNEQNPEHEPEPTEPSGLSILKFTQEHPNRRPEIIEGILRRGELLNVIGAPKAGKSWFIYNLAFSLAAGRQWLGRNLQPCRVLLIDNEIHPSELSFRLRSVSEAMSLRLERIANNFVIEAMRGNLVDLAGVETIIESYDREPDTFDVIIIDAFYRILPEGISENDNAAMTAVYNRLDRIASTTGAAIVLNHHTAKGDQSQKGITDVGAGAGAMMRATDTHLILRPHELEGCAVMEAVCRSNRQPQPSTICFDFPLWSAKHIEPVLAKPESRSGAKQARQDEETDAAVLKSVSERGGAFAGMIRKDTGFSADRVTRAAERLVDTDVLTYSMRIADRQKEPSKWYSLRED
ncbi:MAG: AAA family ATPase [Planctomycetota bacterium]